MSPRILQSALGVAIAIVGNLLADVAAIVVMRAHGGDGLGCGSSLDPSGRFNLLTALILTYGGAQLVLGGLAFGVSLLLKPPVPFWAALRAGWAVLALLSVLSMFYPGC
ncbi:hypothetical protein ACQP1P_18425 [Dactylosporangium sp. CA-052675]|uniref:hypothetical protein n=1 Tax=unclassified Dactylosporangium TaxID=2621675 RepID=UPI00331ACF36